MAGFTPGPWRAEASSASFWFIERVNELGIVAGTWSGGLENHEANALLIAAAPDLYATLVEARDFIAEQLDTDLRSACLIDKEGRPRRETLHDIALPFIEDTEALLARLDAALAKAIEQPSRDDRAEREAAAVLGGSERPSPVDIPDAVRNG